jgi:glycosyltransferase involved in cell wall biosynthesis
MSSFTIGIITYNEEANIERCLLSCKRISYPHDVLVVDSHSTDKTVALCQKRKAKVLLHPFTDYASQRNFLIEQVTTDYIFMLDADEEITDELGRSIQKLFENFSLGIEGAFMNRRCIFNGQILQYTFQPDRCLKLFRRQPDRRYTGIVHEKLTDLPADLPVLEGDLNHYSWRSIPHYLTKLNQYAELDGTSQHKSRIIYLAPFAAGHAFCKFYFLKLGFMDGLNGLFFATGHAMYIILKYYYSRQKTHEA